jgi:hypothetical protein
MTLIVTEVEEEDPVPSTALRPGNSLHGLETSMVDICAYMKMRLGQLVLQLRRTYDTFFQGDFSSAQFGECGAHAIQCSQR